MNEKKGRGRTRHASTPATRAVLLLAFAGLSAACSDNDPRPRGPQEFQATLTELHAVKKGSDETLTLEELPVEGPTITLDR